MRIFIDIGHPAHVHYFRNFIELMKAKGHEFFVSARNRSMIHYLLDHYQIQYFDRGKGRNGIIGKLFYMLIADIRLFKMALRFKPDIYLSFASPYLAQVSWLLHKPHIVIDDTEHARFNHMLYKPFSKVFLNPVSFRKDFGIRQIFFNSFVELFYLFPKYFTPNPDVLKILGLTPDSKFALLRFVSWEANHDIGHSGLDLVNKKRLITLLLEKEYKVFISSETDKNDLFFKPYLLKMAPELIHDLMAYSTLLVTEGATMASECAMMGTPAIYVNSLDAGSLRDLEDKYHLIFGFRSSEGVIEKVNELLSLINLRKIFQERRQKILDEKIDLTAFLVWFVENLPESIQVLNENSNYQNRFR
jgi:uncharacterized protein